MLTNSKHTLVKLWEYLIYNKRLDQNFPLPAVVFDQDQEEKNLIDPRAFCYCVRGQNAIFSSKELENLPLRFRMGVLLHELGHLVTDSFDGDESEVDVDLWAMTVAPEAKYVYEDCWYTREKSNDQKILAENLETVSQEFMKHVMLNDWSGEN